MTDRRAPPPSEAPHLSQAISFLDMRSSDPSLKKKVDKERERLEKIAAKQQKEQRKWEKEKEKQEKKEKEKADKQAEKEAGKRKEKKQLLGQSLPW